MADAEAVLGDEDRKLVVLARGARGRVAAPEGAALRDETGRSTSAATVDLPGLAISALRLAVAQAAASGARGLESAVVVSGRDGLDPDDVAAVRALGGPGVVVTLAAPDGRVVAAVTT